MGGQVVFHTLVATYTETVFVFIAGNLQNEWMTVYHFISGLSMKGSQRKTDHHLIIKRIVESQDSMT